MKFDKFSFQQLRDAIEFEMQKTDDVKLATAIAVKKLTKDPYHYHKYLKKATAIQTGIKVEAEHKETIQFIKDHLKRYGKLPEDKDIYKHIAKNHVDEVQDYYIRLLAMENGVRADKKRSKIELDIIKFLIANPNPPDEKVHKFAEDNNINPHKLEAMIYKLATERALESEGMIKAGDRMGPHKYIKRVPKKTGKGYIYFYNKEQVKNYLERGIVPEQKKGFNLIDKIKSLFGFGDKDRAEEKVKEDYKINQIKEKYDISFKVWTDHLTEYFLNKEKWQKVFGGKSAKPESGKEPGKSEGTGEKKEKKEPKEKKEKTPSRFKIGVMKIINDIYGNPVKVEPVQVQGEGESSIFPFLKKGMYITMRESGRTAKVVGWGIGKESGKEIVKIRYIAGYAGSHNPFPVFGPKVQVFAKDVILKDKQGNKEMPGTSETKSPDNFETMPDQEPDWVTEGVETGHKTVNVPEGLFAHDNENNYYHINGKVFYKRKADEIAGVQGHAFPDQTPVSIEQFLNENINNVDVDDSVKVNAGARTKRGQAIQESIGTMIENVMDYIKRGNIDAQDFLSGFDVTKHADTDLGRYAKNPIAWKAIIAAVKKKYFPTEQDVNAAIESKDRAERGHVELVETPEQKDKKIVAEISNVKPETRAESEAAIDGKEKEPWALSFDNYKQSLINYRNEYFIKELNRRIESYEKKLTGEEIKKVSGDKGQFTKMMQDHLNEYKKTLSEYLAGTIDEKQKQNPSWDYILKQYNELKDKESTEAKALKRKLNIRENKARAEHERLIKKAIDDGKIVPANVLNEYPEIQEEKKSKIQRPDINYKPKETEREIYVMGNKADASKRKLKIKDYSAVQAKDVFLSDVETILNVPRPSYIPEMDLENFSGYSGKNQNFDVARLGVNQYIIVDKRYDYISRAEKQRWKVKPEVLSPEDAIKDNIEDGKYYLMNAETLAATWDYYRKLYQATEIKKNEEKQDREEANYNRQKEKTLAAGRDWTYAAFKRKGIRPQKANPDAYSMSLSQGRFIQDIEGRTGTEHDMRHGELNHQIFANYQTMLKELEYKINDLRMQREYDDEINTYKKGEETSYGDSGLKNDLLKSHGIKVKRQNGTEIDDQDVAKIGMLMDDLYSVFGNRKTISEKYGLKVSYAGEKRMHASKAIGCFIKERKCIAISDTGIEGRGFTVAHEFAHFLDSYLGEKVNNHFSSDQEGHISNDIAKKFRSNVSLNTGKMGEQTIQYYNRTCECFARAMEQYYSIKQNVQDELYKKAEKTNEYVDHDRFVRDIMPLCERFLQENDSLLKAMIFKVYDKATKRTIYKKIESSSENFSIL